MVGYISFIEGRLIATVPSWHSFSVSCQSTGPFEGRRALTADGSGVSGSCGRVWAHVWGEG